VEITIEEVRQNVDQRDQVVSSTLSLAFEEIYARKLRVALESEARSTINMLAIIV